MIQFLNARSVILGFAVLSLFAYSGHPRVSGQTADKAAGGLSGPAEFNVQYQARNPRRCKALNAPPKPEQLVAAVQCEMEVDRPTGLFLMQEVQVQMGEQRGYDVQIDGNLEEIDASAPVFPLAGSLKQFWCSPVGVGYPAGANCTVSPMPQATGKCWKTTFGDWKCNLVGPAPNQRTGFPGPTDY